MPSDFVHDHNRYLKGIMAQIMKEGMRKDLIHALCVELKFSLVDSVNYHGKPTYITRDGKKYLRLYTSYDEMQDYFPYWGNCHYSFVSFLEALRTPAFFETNSTDYNVEFLGEYESGDGMIFDPEGMGFVIEGELLDRLNEFFKINLYTVAELKEMFDNIDNSRLEDLFKQNLKDWDEIIMEFGKSTVLFSINLRKMEEYEEYLTLFDVLKFDGLGFNNEISISTTKDIPESQYAVIVNFKKAVDHVLNFGLKGLTVTTSYGEEYMSRDLLIDKYEMIEKHCDDEKLGVSQDCVFKL